MANILKYIKIILSYIHGVILCVVYTLLPKRKLVCGESYPRVIVSLTSYGRRVSHTLKYPVMSMLVQTKRPDKIVVWLDDDNYSEFNLPSSLRKFIKYGVEVCFCSDIRSYKKLVPSLGKYPDDIIITIDDDLIYRRKTLECLLAKHKEYPDSIICTSGHVPVFDANGLLPYKEWQMYLNRTDSKLVFPLGGTGTLYPPHSLYKDTTNSSLFMNLSPKADDVWFWIMALLNGRMVRLAESGPMFRHLDLLYQFTHKQSSLMEDNVGGNMNDIQITAVFSHYGIEKDKGSIEKMISEM